MSGICGVIHWDGEPVNPENLKRMAEAAAYRGPDGIQYWIEGNVGVAFLALHTTPESFIEKQPFRSKDGRYLIAADARVDNRTELIDFLGKKGLFEPVDLERHTVTDVQILMAAFLAWGSSCPEHLCGDYAFVVIDLAQESVFAARDHTALRPFFYCNQAQSFLFASAIRSITAILPASPQINQLVLAEYYCYKFYRQVAETIYESIQRLPAGCFLNASSKNLEINQHWHFINGPIIYYRDPREHYEAFNDLFKKVLVEQSRTHQKLAVQLSGGLDSSAIACVLHEIKTAGLMNDHQNVKLYTLAFEEQSAANEIYYQDAVIDACPTFEALKIPGDSFWGFQEIGDEQGFPIDEPDFFIHRGIEMPLMREAHNDGCRVLFSGIGGDELFDIRLRSLEILLDLPPNLWLPGIFTLFRKPGLRTIAAEAARKTLSGHKAGAHEFSYPDLDWLKRPWRQKLVDSQSKVFRLQLPERFETNVQRVRQTRTLFTGFALKLHEYAGFLASTSGLEYRLPFLDRRIINFVFRVPPHLLVTLQPRQQFKLFLKKALQKVLPSHLLDRNDKAQMGEIIWKGLEKEIEKLTRIQSQIASDQVEFVDFLKYNTTWNHFLNEEMTIRTRNTFTPILVQAWLNSIYHL